MNVESISGWLAAIGVPPEVISIGRESDNAWCVLRTERVLPVTEQARAGEVRASDGVEAAAVPPDAPEKGRPSNAVADVSEQVVVAWEVFWREQGNRYDWASFTNEQVACHYLFGRLAWSQVARGAVGVLPALDRPPASTPNG